MTASGWHLRTAQKVVLALFGIIFTLASASAASDADSSGLTNQQCYGKDSGCTQMCGEVAGELRYECFSICDRMLDRCLTTGEWSDSGITVDPSTGKPPNRRDLLSSALIRMMMVLGDTDRDGTLSLKEVLSLKGRISRGVEPSDDPNTPA